MDANTFEIGNLTIRPKRMPGRTQFHVARRFGVLLGKLADILPAVEALRAQPTGGAKSDTERALLAAAAPFGAVLAEIPDEQADYILDACLGAAEVKQPGGLGWAALRVNGVTMYPLDMVGELVVAAHVIKANLAGFTDALAGLGIDAAKILKSAG